MILTALMATTWTQADIDILKAAIGSGVLSVSYAGPPQRSITYQSLDAMRRLLAEMVAQVSAAPSYRLATTRKGL